MERPRSNSLTNGKLDSPRSSMLDSPRISVLPLEPIAEGKEPPLHALDVAAAALNLGRASKEDVVVGVYCDVRDVVAPGAKLVVVGGPPTLGGWEVERAVAVPDGGALRVLLHRTHLPLEFKFAVLGPDRVVWQKGLNFRIDGTSSRKAVSVAFFEGEVTRADKSPVTAAGDYSWKHYEGLLRSGAPCPVMLDCSPVFVDEKSSIGAVVLRAAGMLASFGPAPALPAAAATTGPLEGSAEERAARAEEEARLLRGEREAGRRLLERRAAEARETEGRLREAEKRAREAEARAALLERQLGDWREAAGREDAALKAALREARAEAGAAAGRASGLEHNVGALTAEVQALKARREAELRERDRAAEETIAAAEERERELARVVKEARAAVEAAEKRAIEFEARAKAAEERSKGAEGRAVELAEALTAASAAAERRAGELQAALKAGEEKLRGAEGRAGKAETKLREVEAKAAASEAKAGEVDAKIRDVDATVRAIAREAEGRMREADARAAAAEAKLREAEAKLREAEGKLAEAEAKGEKGSGMLAKRGAGPEALDNKQAALVLRLEAEVVRLQDELRRASRPAWGIFSCGSNKGKC